MLPARAIACSSLAAVALAIGGCGEDRAAGGRATGTSPTPADEPATAVGKVVATVSVSLAEYRLNPVNPRVARGGAVAFVATNDGQTTHALAVDGPAGTVSSKPLAPGERRTIVVRLPPGTYKWLCPIADHEERGMAGRVRVAE
jgi:uncharacterized cupredoxin-like copper-binding protein